LRRGEISIRLPSSLEYIPLLREIGERVGFFLGMPEEKIHALKLILEESATNVVRHSLGEDKGLFYEVIFHPKEKGIKIIIKDKGKGTRKLSPIPLDEVIEKEREGGLGLRMLEKLTENVTFRKRGKTNELTLEVAWD